MGSVVRLVVSGAMWNIGAVFFLKASWPIAGIFIARELGVEALGLFGLMQSAIVMIANVPSQAIITVNGKCVGSWSEEKKNLVSGEIAATLVLTLLIVMVILLFGIFKPKYLAEILFGSAQSVEVLGAFILIAIFTVLNAWPQGCLTGLGKFKLIAALNFIGALLTISLVYFFTASFGFFGVLGGLAAGQVILGLLLFSTAFFTLYSSRAAPNVRFIRPGLKAVNHTALPILVSGLMVAPIYWYANTMLAMVDGGLAALGVYTVAFQWGSLFSQISVSLGGVLIPYLARQEGEKRNDVEGMNQLGPWIIVTIGVLPLIAFPEIITFLYGGRIESNVLAMPLALVLIASTVTAFKSGIARKVIVLDMAWFSVIGNLCWGAMFLTAVYLFRSSGATGMAGALLLAHIFHFALTTPYFVSKKILARKFIADPFVMIVWFLPILCIAISLGTFSNISHIVSFAFILTGMLVCIRKLCGRLF